MARRKPPPPRPKMPARLRAFHPGDWPDPLDWDDDAEVVAKQTRAWTAMPNDEARFAWWRSEDPVERARYRYSWARFAWMDANEVDFVDVLAEERAIRLATFDRREERW
jgi:hypothetical protein